MASHIPLNETRNNSPSNILWPKRLECPLKMGHHERIESMLGILKRYLGTSPVLSKTPEVFLLIRGIGGHFASKSSRVRLAMLRTFATCWSKVMASPSPLFAFCLRRRTLFAHVALQNFRE